MPGPVWSPVPPERKKKRGEKFLSYKFQFFFFFNMLGVRLRRDCVPEMFFPTLVVLDYTHSRLWGIQYFRRTVLLRVVLRKPQWGLQVTSCPLCYHVGYNLKLLGLLCWTGWLKNCFAVICHLLKCFAISYLLMTPNYTLLALRLILWTPGPVPAPYSLGCPWGLSKNLVRSHLPITSSALLPTLFSQFQLIVT